MATEEWTPADLLGASARVWSACAIQAGVNLEVFTALAEGPLTASELVAQWLVQERGLSLLLRALKALGLLARAGEGYALTDFSRRYLVRTAPDYLGSIIQHHSYLMRDWIHLETVVREGGPAPEVNSRYQDDPEAREAFQMGMFNVARLQAPYIAERLDLRGCRRLLDLGGGPGTYSVSFCQQHPELRAWVYDLPETRPFAERVIQRFHLEDRVQFIAGNCIEEAIPGSFDGVWISHLLHGYGPETGLGILQRALGVLEPGGSIWVHDFILDPTLDGPLFPALSSLQMLVSSEEGRAYSEPQLAELLRQAGCGQVERLPWELPRQAGILVGSRC